MIPTRRFDVARDFTLPGRTEIGNSAAFMNPQRMFDFLSTTRFAPNRVVAHFRLVAQRLRSLLPRSLAVACSLVAAETLCFGVEPFVVELWPAQAPDETGTIGPERIRMSPKLDRLQVEVTESTRLITAVSKPSMTIHLPEPSRNTGAAVLIFPGGGYWDLYWQLEGEEVADWLSRSGITGVILKYRVPRRPGEPEAEPAKRPLQDAQRAMRLLRHRAKEWGFDPNRIGVMGFSAGGHLAIATATQFEHQTYLAVDGVDQLSCRPNFAVPVYSGYLKAKDRMELAEGITVPPQTPPVFLVHGHNDLISPPEHSVLMYLALKKAGISAELHLFANTAHDFGVRSADRPYAQWTDLCQRWMRDQQFLREPDSSPKIP